MSLGGTDFFRELARRYMPQPGTMGKGSGGALPPGSNPQFQGYSNYFRQGAPMQGMWTSKGPRGFANAADPNAAYRRTHYGPGGAENQAVFASSGDRYANLTSDPFAMGPGQAGF